jgi:hypothetical protein
MGQDNLYTDIDGLRSFAETHDDVSTGMSGLTASAYDAAGVAATHGPIASDVHNSLRGVIDARQGAQRSVSDIGERLAASLRQAAYSYEGVDHGSAERLRTAADAVEGATAPGSTGGTSGSAANGGGNFKDVSATMTGAMKDAVGALGGVLGPMTSGIGSAAGSLGSGLSSAASALTNSLSQAVSQAAKAAPSTARAVPAAASTGGGVEQAGHQGGQSDHQGGQSDHQTHAGRDDSAAVKEVSDVGADAGPGEDTAAGKAPAEHVILARSTSAPTGGGTVV